MSDPVWQSVRVAMNEFKLLNRLDPGLLLDWLRPVWGYLAGRGLVWPEGSGAGLDCDRLAEILMGSDAGMPRVLVDSLCLVQGMATEAGMDLLVVAAREEGLDLESGVEPTPENVAVRAWLSCPALMERVHACHVVSRRRAFTHFSMALDPPPVFPAPLPVKLRAIEKRLDDFYRASSRGGGARVFACARPREWWFVIRHGLAMRRFESLTGGDLSTVCFRPVGYDVLAYEPERGLLRIHCGTVRERTVILRAFGSCFFGDPAVFPPSSRYTLGPLLEPGRTSFACAGIPGARSVQLTGLEIHSPGSPSGRITIDAEDVFRFLCSGRVEPPRHGGDLTRATFTVNFAGEIRARTFSVIPSNKLLYSREADSDWVEPWLEQHGFVHRTES